MKLSAPSRALPCLLLYILLSRLTFQNLESMNYSQVSNVGRQSWGRLRSAAARPWLLYRCAWFRRAGCFCARSNSLVNLEFLLAIQSLQSTPRYSGTGLLWCEPVSCSRILGKISAASPLFRAPVYLCRLFHSIAADSIRCPLKLHWTLHCTPGSTWFA